MQLLIGALMLAAQTAAPAGVEALGWLSGSWEAGDARRWTEEQWTSPRAGMMLGTSRTGRDGRIVEFEFIRIAPDESGTLTYWAQPGGQAPVGFKLVQASGTSAVFENPGHDFPQRIVYRREGARLTATISDIKGGNRRSWTFRRR